MITCYCGESADGLACEACSRRFCLAHSAVGICTACELEFYEQRDASQSYKLWKWAGYLLPWLVLLMLARPVIGEYGWFARGGSVRSFSTGIPLLDLAIFAAVLALVLGGGLGAMRARSLRRAFVAERQASPRG